MSSTMPKPEYITIADNLRIPRIINGLWQLAGGHDPDVDIAQAAAGMRPLIDAGLYCFDMADHYGSAELVIGQHHRTSEQEVIAFTKWCPTKTKDVAFSDALDAIDLSSSRMNLQKINLLQYHIWDYTDLSYFRNLEGLAGLQRDQRIECIGITNVDVFHLRVLLDSGFKIKTNQVSCSVIDRRFNAGQLKDTCNQFDVKLLAYGTLLGGFISEKWIDQPEPKDLSTLNWSLRKYSRFIKEAGGWDVFQKVLKTLVKVAQKHHVSVAAVAIRHVLDYQHVAAVIVGTRLSSDSVAHIRGQLEAFSFRLDEEDQAMIKDVQQNLKQIPGGSGDEYRRPPFLTAAGDLSDHLKENERDHVIEAAVKNGKRVELLSYDKSYGRTCHALRTNNIIRVSGVTACSSTLPDRALGGDSAYSQTVVCLDIIDRALKDLGASLVDVVRTRVIIRRECDLGAVSEPHHHAFNRLGVHPAYSMTIGSPFGKDFLVEIEAEAEIGASKAGVLEVGIGLNALKVEDVC